MVWARELIESVEREKPTVARLAELASLAVQVDAGLLRRLRQQLVAGADPGVEADLWFSPLVESQDLEACVFHPAVALQLREGLLARGSALIAEVAALMVEAHAHLPAAIRLEEELTALAFSEAPDAETRMEEALEPALRALLDPDETRSLEVARWAMHAAPRFHERLRSLPAAQALVLGAALRLEQPALADDVDQSTLPVEGLAWLLPEAALAERMKVGVTLVSNGVRFERAEDAEQVLELPKTNPVLVSLRWVEIGRTRHRRLVRAAPGAFVEIPRRPRRIEIVTLAGEVYLLAEAAKSAADRAVPEAPTDVPAAFLKSCLKVWDGGWSTAVAFPVAEGLWVTAKAAVGGVRELRAIGAPADDFAVLNADDPKAAVLVLRLLESRRMSVTLPLGQSPIQREDPCSVVAFRKTRAIPLRATFGRAPGARRFRLVVEGELEASYEGAPVLQGGSIIGIVVDVHSFSKEGAGLWLTALSSEAIREALAGVKVPLYPEDDDRVQPGAVTCAQFVRDGRHVIVGTPNGAIRLHDGQNGAVVADVPAHRGAVQALACTVEHDWLVVVSGSSDGTVKVWDFEKDDPVRTYRPGAPVHALAVPPDARHVMAGLGDGTVTSLPLLREGVEQSERAHEGSVRALATNSSGRTVSGGSDGLVIVWDGLQRTHVLEGHTDGVLAVALTPDGRCVVSGSADRTVRVWDIEPGRTLRVLTGHNDYVQALAVTPDGKRIVSGSKDGTLRVWELESGRSLATLGVHPGGVLSVGLSSDGRRAVAGSANGFVHVWDIASSRLVREFKGGPARVFVSYASRGLDLAERVAAALDASGLRTFLPRSTDPPGAPLTKMVEHIIAQSELVLALVTEEAARAPWLQAELAQAVSLKKRVLPVSSGRVEIERALPRELWSVTGYALDDRQKGGGLPGLVALVERMLRPEGIGSNAEEGVSSPQRVGTQRMQTFPTSPRTKVRSTSRPPSRKKSSKYVKAPSSRRPPRSDAKRPLKRKK